MFSHEAWHETFLIKPLEMGFFYMLRNEIGFWLE